MSTIFNKDTDTVTIPISMYHKLISDSNKLGTYREYVKELKAIIEGDDR